MENVGVEPRTATDGGNVTELFGDRGGLVDGRVARDDRPTVEVVMRPVDLLAARVRRDEQRTAHPERLRTMRESVEGAHATDGQVQGVRERHRRHDADAQAGERPRPDADGDARQVCGRHVGFREHRLDRGCQDLGVTPRVDRRGAGDDVTPVVQGCRDGGGGRIDREKHPSSLSAGRNSPDEAAGRLGAEGSRRAAPGEVPADAERTRCPRLRLRLRRGHDRCTRNVHLQDECA